MAVQAFIREARLEDVVAVSALVTELGYPTSPGEMRERLGCLLARPDHVLFVAEIEGAVAGLVGAYLVEALEYSGKYGRLTGIVVDKNLRGCGIGRQLLERIETWLVEQGAWMSILTSGSQRSESHQFYRHLGYAETGLRFAKRLRVDELEKQGGRHGF